MAQFSEEEANVAKHYGEAAFEAELARLPQDSPVELGVTLRWLRRVAKAGDLVAEIGVGGGHYTEFLARAGCRLHLVDISARLLDEVMDKLRRVGLEDCVVGCHHVSGARLESLPSESVDLALLMGPIYHLQALADRQRSVRESARILKPGGTVFAAGINRLAYLRDLLRFKFAAITERVAFHQRYLQDGNLDPEHAPPIGYSHLTTAGEFRALLAGQFETTAFLGVESFTAAWQGLFRELPEAKRELWLDLVEETGRTPEGIGQSDHFLFIGRKHRTEERKMATLGMIEYQDASPEVRAVYDEIMAARKTDRVNNFWKAIAHDPGTLRRTWESVKQIMAPRALDPLTKEMLYVAVSATNQCGYCIASHTASARKAGMTPAMFAELMAVVGMANETNRLASGYQVEIDEQFKT